MLTLPYVYCAICCKRYFHHRCAADARLPAKDGGGARLRRNPVSRRDPAELRLVRDGPARGPATITDRGMHLCSPVADRPNGRRLSQAADHEKI